MYRASEQHSNIGQFNLLFSIAFMENQTDGNNVLLWMFLS